MFHECCQDLIEKRGLPEVNVRDNYDLVASFLSAQSTPESHGPDDDDDDALRKSLLLLFRLLWGQACNIMEQKRTEIELLEKAPPEVEDSETGQSQDKTEDTTWRLDAPSGRLNGSQGSILDASGRVSGQNSSISGYLFHISH